MKPIGIAIIGYGKIAADQHVPSIGKNDRFELLATSSRSGQGVARTFTDWRQMIREVEGLEAVAITTPPGPRLEIAQECAAAGLHILLEKPPAATISEAELFRVIAAQHEVTLFATWHARYNPAVFAAADLLSGKTVSSLRIIWHEDVHKWHPGQDWIWEPGGFGVFDPGINALSIATAIMPQPLFVKSADLQVPENAQTPIAAEVSFGGNLSASLDWRRSEGEEWTIHVETDDGLVVRLEKGGADLIVNGVAQPSEGMGEYPSVYTRFVDLIDNRRSDVDLTPLRLVADCLLVGRTHRTDPVERT
ncbi:Gfo/Idh/MocA family protein [Sphingomonas alba]|uniref:Gfo/Idh/MocA family oxidoreductase n=1 Tax=Sphingomonas alba TaxID=2908208 RepID=A0ABT0RJB6_9SPHN|nr:Gfo/Idh/MocA family oxidoreductase [Sphingomonas alba]MCL6682678.1 Gfo/Idh/MocA family oxidoreductase [Sphingomonas alba]